MFTIGKLFHITHVVDDLEAVDRWYDDVFSAKRFYNGYEALAGRNASLIAIGDVAMEPMMPAKVEPLQNLSVKKFHDRFGQHFHSMAWYVDDIEAIAERLTSNNLRLFNIVGQAVKPPVAPQFHAIPWHETDGDSDTGVKQPHTFAGVWTHPKETSGQLEFAVYDEFIPDPRMATSWSNTPWLEHPLRIERASHIGVVVTNLGKAKQLYCDILDGTLLHEEEIAGRKQSAFVAIGEDTVVELSQPLSLNSPEGHALAKHGEGIYSLIFKTKDLRQAQDFLKSKQHHPHADGEETIVLSPDQAFGMVIGFTQRRLPDDPR